MLIIKINLAPIVSRLNYVAISYMTVLFVALIIESFLLCRKYYFPTKNEVDDENHSSKVQPNAPIEMYTQ